MRDKFGDEWYELLKDYLKSERFEKIKSTLYYQYKEKKSIIPPFKSPLYFKVFKDLQPSRIKVVILGQDPYHDKGTYTGYAFDNAYSSKLSPSLRNILKEIDRTYPENVNDLRFGGIDRWDLSRWVKQGVFLINTALSVEEGKPDSHTAIWKPFTIEWIQRLSKENSELVWLLWGSKSQFYEKFITNSTHRVIKCGHPSPLNRSNPFIGSDCFLECNKDLIGRNKTEIVW